MAIQHRGFAFIDIFSPCVTFNKDNTYEFFRPRVKKLEDEGHDPSDWKAACEKGLVWGDEIYTGLYFQAERSTLLDEEPIMAEGVPMSQRPLALTDEQAERIIKRMM